MFLLDALRLRKSAFSGGTEIAQSEAVWMRVHHVERRQWWLWASAIAVNLLLVGGLASFALPFLFGKSDPDFMLNLRQSLRGLIALVLLFDLYALYQQLQIYRIRRELAASQKIFHLIGEYAADLIAVVDAAGQRLYNSPAYEKVLGYTPEELKATNSLEQVHPDDRAKVIEAGAEAQRTGVGRALEYRFRHKNGTWRILESSASAVRNDRGEVEYLVIVNRDITERKHAEETLRLRDDQLRQAQKMEAVGRLSGGIAHDFNNSLSVIIGYSEILETRVPSSDPNHQNIQQIKKAGLRAASLTRQLLAFSRQQVLEPRVLDLNAVVADLAKMLRRLIPEDIELTINLQPALGRVKTDQAQIEQAIMNLAVNARDAMPENGKLTIETQNAELDETLAQSSPYVQPGPYVLLTVSDTGIGMDKETLARVFEPFYTTKEKGKGTGLGLAMVYGFVKQSGGFIWVTSEPGKGATFKIYLPRVAESVERVGTAVAPSASSVRSEMVLLVEDEESLRTLICKQLVDGGFRVLAPASCAEAVELAQQGAAKSTFC